MKRQHIEMLIGFLLLICVCFGLFYAAKIKDADRDEPIGWQFPDAIEARYAVPWTAPNDDAAPFSNQAAETLDEPWKSLALQNLKSGKINVSIQAKSELAMRPELFAPYGATKEQVDTVAKADRFLVLREKDKPCWPPTREFVARETAAAVARKLNSVVVDAVRDRVMSSEQALEHMKDKTEREAFSHWTPIIVTPEEDGEWMTSNGLSRLGMPEIEVTKVPPQMSREMVYAVSGLAWVVAKRANAAASKGETSIFLPNNLEVTAADISETMGHEVKGKKTTFHLKLCPREKDSVNLWLTLTPPPGSKKTPGEYYFDRLAELYGRPSDDVTKFRSNPAMEKAMATARASLSTAREKFLADPLQTKGRVLIKFMITDGNSKEYLWGCVTDWSSADKLSLSCESTADLSADYRPGKIIQIKEDIIRDWAFQDSNGDITEGNWTSKVLESNK